MMVWIIYYFYKSHYMRMIHLFHNSHFFFYLINLRRSWNQSSSFHFLFINDLHREYLPWICINYFLNFRKFTFSDLINYNILIDLFLSPFFLKYTWICRYCVLTQLSRKYGWFWKIWLATNWFLFSIQT